MAYTIFFLKLFGRAWQTRHPLYKIGIIGFGLSQAASYYILKATPPALWNGARSLAEQKVILAFQTGCAVLFIVGAGLNLYREAKAARKPPKAEAG